MPIEPTGLPSIERWNTQADVPAKLRDNQGTAEFPTQFQSLLDAPDITTNSPAPPSDDSELRQAFHDFVGQTLFGQWIASMRSTQGKPAYMHGGRAEEIFQNQLDQVLAEEMSKASADSLADPMYELFRLHRGS